MTPLAESFDFTGRRVLITGAANGFGQAAARRFHAQGASLVLADIEAKPLAELAAELGAQSFVFDQADSNSINEMAAAVGTVDVLINNAGALVAKPLLDTSEAEARHLIDTDFLGVFLLTQQFGRRMVAQGRGVIVSVGSQTAFCGGENRGIYAAAKAAVSQLTRAAAVEWGPHGVRVVTLLPGYVATPLTARNRYPMPFLLDADTFADRAWRAIQAGASRRVIPWQMAIVARLLHALPDALFDRLFAGRGRKHRRGER